MKISKTPISIKKKSDDIALNFFSSHSWKKEWNLAIYNNMYRPTGYYAKWNKSDRERQILYDFTYMSNLKNKRNEQAKQRRNRFIDTENNPVFVRGEG